MAVQRLRVREPSFDGSKKRSRPDLYVYVALSEMNPWFCGIGPSDANGRLELIGGMPSTIIWLCVW